MSDKIVWVKLLKPWGGFKVGDVVRFGEAKAALRIANGEGVEVPPPKPEKKPKAETATAEPKAETAEVAPRKQRKRKPETV